MKKTKSFQERFKSILFAESKTLLLVFRERFQTLKIKFKIFLTNLNLLKYRIFCIQNSVTIT